MRGQQPGVGQGPALLGRVLDGGQPGHDGGQLGPDRPGLVGEVDGQTSATTPDGQVGHGGPQGCRAADQLAQGGGPPQVDVGVVLPGEAHPAQHLDGPVGRLDVPVEGERGGQVDRELARPAGRAVMVERGDGVPGGGHRLVGRHQHVGQPVLHALELPDGPTELLAGPGVLGGGLEAPAGAARGRRGQNGEGHGAHGVGRGALEVASRGNGGAGQGPGGDRPGGVEAGQGGDGDPGAALDHDPLLVAVHGHRGQQVGDHGPVDDGPDLAVDDEGAVVGHGGTQSADGAGRPVGAAGRDDQRGRAGAVGQAGQQLLGHRPALGPDHGSHHRRGVPGTHRGVAPQLLGHDRRLEEAAPWPPKASGTCTPR